MLFRSIAKEALFKAREQIESEFGKKYLPAKPNNYVTKAKGAQEAHEAIRPTMIDFTPQIAASYLEKDALKLYTLIYNRFLASQMSDARFESQTVSFTCSDATFRASGRKLLFDGFYRVYGDSDKDKLLPQLDKGDNATLDKLDANQHFTEPPSRYSEASLIKKLESLGIGRPSTYAPTISILTARDYINIEKKQLVPSEIAFTITELLEKYFPNIVDSNFTSSMENTLDEIAENEKDWQKVLSEFYTPFIKKVEDGKANIPSQKVVIPTGENCPECGEPLLQRKGRFGEFIACSGFPKCKYSKNLTATAKKEPVKIDVKCPECGSDIIERISRRGKFYGCSAYPKCTFISTHQPTDVKCEKCGGTMASRVFRKKDIYECIKCKERVEKA